MPVLNAAYRIHAAVTAWEGVTAGPHRFGGTEYRYDTREIGHSHGDHMVDIPFPSAVREDIVRAGLAQPHHVLPDTGWVSIYLRTDEDVTRAIDLLRRSYDLAVARRSARSGA